MKAVLSRWKASGRSWIGRQALRWSGIEQLQGINQRILGESLQTAETPHSSVEYLSAALQALRVTYSASGTPVPSTGAVVVVANHPYGGLEGLLLLHWLLQSRRDVKVLANDWLVAFMPLRPLLVGVDVFGGRDASGSAQRNARAMREALRHLQGGGVLLVFPAGSVSHLQAGRSSVAPVVCDGPWRLGAAHLLARTGAVALPVWVEGRNSASFQAAGLVHPMLRTVLLPRELLNKAGQHVSIHSGGAVPEIRWRREGDAQGVTHYLRLRTSLAGAFRDGLGDDSGSLPVESHCGTAGGANGRSVAEIALPIDAKVIAAELSGLARDAILVDAGRFRVYRLRRRDAPQTVLEIGRLREMTFRKVGEGTHFSRDLDRFDDHYWHLVLWEAEKLEIAGAYRLVAVDEARESAGRAGLYTSTLFRFLEPAPALLSRGVELGRSFVVPGYQRQHLPLMLLWKAIGTMVMTERRRRLLFGPASIPCSMAPEAVAVAVEWLRLHRQHPGFAPLVAGRTPPSLRRLPRHVRADLALVADVEALDRLICDLNPGSGEGLPPLLRQYLRMEAKFLAVNRDAAFADSLDVLVLVDLEKVPRRVLTRLVGKDVMEQWNSRDGDDVFMTFPFRRETKLSQNDRIT